MALLTLHRQQSRLRRSRIPRYLRHRLRRSLRTLTVDQKDILDPRPHIPNPHKSQRPTRHRPPASLQNPSLASHQKILSRRRPVQNAPRSNLDTAKYRPNTRVPCKHRTLEPRLRSKDIYQRTQRKQLGPAVERQPAHPRRVTTHQLFAIPHSQSPILHAHIHVPRHPPRRRTRLALGSYQWRIRGLNRDSCAGSIAV